MTRTCDSLLLDERPIDDAERRFWQGRPVLVTGATGLLGTWLLRRLLNAGATVVGLVRNGTPRSLVPPAEPPKPLDIPTVQGDIRDQALLERALKERQIDTVFHTAAQAIVGAANKNPVATFETNIQGTWSLLEACRQSPGVRQVIVTSSDKAYGAHTVLPYREDMALIGRHPYDVSKSCSDLVATTYAHSYRVPIALTRCGNFFGGGDLNWNRIIPGTIRSLLNGERPLIRSDGQFVRDYLYAEDAAAAHMRLARALADDRSLTGEAFNFSHEVRLAVLDLVEHITRLVGASLTPDVRNEASLEIRAQYLSAAKARERLGWKPLFTLAEGLQRTIAWYRAFLSDGRSAPSHPPAPVPAPPRAGRYSS